MKSLIHRSGAAKLIILHAIFVFTTVSAIAQSLPLAKPESVQMSSEALNRIDSIVNAGIAGNKLPGAVVLIGRKGKIVFRRAYGNRSTQPVKEKMTPDTIFDMASLTKVMATATSITQLIDKGKIQLADRIDKYIPNIDDPEAKAVTIEELLTHVSGYEPDFDLREKWEGRAGFLDALKKQKLKNRRGTKFVYSDINYEILGEIIFRVTGEDQAMIVEKRSKAMGMKDTKFNPFGFSQLAIKDGFLASNKANAAALSRIAPTEFYRGQQSYLGDTFSEGDSKGNAVLRGLVHDPTAFRMNGTAGHAGLFSTADDTARFCQMILNGGMSNGKRVLSKSAVDLMTRPYVVSERGDARGLGFDIDTSFSTVRGGVFPRGSFGHTGFTGIGVWIDPLSESFVVFLSNRVHPDGKGDVADVRAQVSTAAASALLDITPSQVETFESEYRSEIQPGIEKFRTRLENSGSLKEKSIDSNNGASRSVLNGIDVLERDSFKQLSGMKIGLVTNHTGRDLEGNSTIDILHDAKNVDLVSLFSPEHGIRGELDQDKITDSKDAKTGLPVYSLYGESRRPKPEQLAGLDAIVFDIQDIGSRFYTYISTLRYVMEEAAKAKIKVIVLDRTNPINGIEVEGPIADSDLLSFVAPHEFPVRHGMTVGEIAKMINSERKIGVNLEVIKMVGWQREFWFDQTGQTWVNPSPNMRSLTEATLYPGIGLLETTNLSVGRGTDTPFEVVGAPWIDGRALAGMLNQSNLTGVRFVPIRFTPNASVFKGEQLGGINIIITDRAKFDPVRTGFAIALALNLKYPKIWKSENYIRLLVNRNVLNSIIANQPISTIENTYKDQLENFKKRRALNLLY